MQTRLFAVIFILSILFPAALGQKRKVKTDTGPGFGVLAGGGVQTFIGKNYWGDKLDNNFNPALHAGANLILPVFGDFWVQSGINFSLKGSRQHIVIDDISKTTNLAYVEVPLFVLFRPQAGEGYILLGAGPYGAYGLFGKERTKVGPVTTELNIKFRDNATDQPASYVYYRGLDAGAGALIGYEMYNWLFAHLNGQLGLMKLNPDYSLPNDQTSKKNLGFSLSAGFRF